MQEKNDSVRIQDFKKYFEGNTYVEEMGLNTRELPKIGAIQRAQFHTTSEGKLFKLEKVRMHRPS